MLYPQKMKKMDIIIMKKFADDVAKDVLEFGNFEVMDISSTRLESYALKRENYDELSARLMEYKRRIQSVAQFLGLDLATAKVQDDRNFMDEFTIKNTLKEMETKVQNYHNELDSLKQRQNDIQIKLNSIRFFGNLDMDLSQTHDIKHFYMGFGAVPSTNYHGFVEALSSIPSVVMNVGTIESQNMVFFTVPNSSRDQVEHILESVYYKDYGIPQDMKGTIKSNIVKYGFELSMTHDEEIWLEERYAKMVKQYSDKLVVMFASVDYHLSTAHLKSEMASTQSVYLFSGWVPEEDVHVISEKIKHTTNDKCLFIETGAAEAMANNHVKPPTRLKNPKILKPFEMLVSMFGTPNYRELDPTLPAAILYLIMFGAMFGDVGHGIFLSLFGLLILGFKKAVGFHPIAKIMFWAGISAAIFGFLYGGVFGHEYHLIDPLWMSPMENIMTILLVSVGFGAAVLSLGMILNIINSIRMKDYGKMIFGASGIAGLMLYWSVIYMVATMMTGGEIIKGIVAIPITAAVCIFLEKRLSYWIFKHGEKEPIAMGIFEVFEAGLSFLSNTVSFLRVGAFALNHGALMSAVFILSQMSKNPVGQWVTIAIGNIIVIALEAMIVGIQSLRLEYYEFFIKFFRADGRRFEGLDIYKRS